MAPNTGPASGQPRSTIQAIDRAVALVRAVAAAGPAGAGLKELTEATGLNASTGRTLLSALITHGVVDQNAGTRRYRLGSSLIEFNRVYLAQVDLSAVAAPILRRLWQETAETVHFSVLQNDLRVDLSVLVGPQLLNVNPTIARFDEAGPASLYRTAAGKVLLAGLSNEGVRATIGSRRYARGHHPLTVEEVLALVDGVRAQGYAENLEEEAAGVCGVAAPVIDQAGDTVGAVCIGYPAVRRTPDHQARLVAAVIDAAAEVSRLLGSAAEVTSS